MENFRFSRRGYRLVEEIYASEENESLLSFDDYSDEENRVSESPFAGEIDVSRRIRIRTDPEEEDDEEKEKAVPPQPEFLRLPTVFAPQPAYRLPGCPAPDRSSDDSPLSIAIDRMLTSLEKTISGLSRGLLAPVDESECDSDTTLIDSSDDESEEEDCDSSTESEATLTESDREPSTRLEEIRELEEPEYIAIEGVTESVSEDWGDYPAESVYQQCPEWAADVPVMVTRMEEDPAIVDLGPPMAQPAPLPTLKICPLLGNCVDKLLGRCRKIHYRHELEKILFPCPAGERCNYVVRNEKYHNARLNNTCLYRHPGETVTTFVERYFNFSDLQRFIASGKK